MEKGYEIYISKNFDEFKLNNKYDKVLIITDENVKNIYLNEFLEVLNLKNVLVYTINPGEASKCLNVYEDIYKFALENNLSRKSVVLALGGGVVGDLSGFFAATYMRGIDVINIPTTLLSQVDSSIGGKNGINIENYKNVMGTFYQPEFIYININTLKTLNKKEFLSGLSEVIKYGIIYDYEFLDYLISNRNKILNLDEECILHIIKKATSTKLHIVKLDEKEGSLRKILNLGHSFGHGIEKLGKLSHGYAISIGTNMAFKLALKRNLINHDYYEKVIKLYKAYNLPINFKNMNSKEILDIMRKDKKNSHLRFSLILPVGNGKVDVVDIEDDAEILSVIEEVKND